MSGRINIVNKSFRVYVAGYIKDEFGEQKQRLSMKDIFNVKNNFNLINNYLKNIYQQNQQIFRKFNSKEKWGKFIKTYFPNRRINLDTLQETVEKIKNDYKIDINNIVKFLYDVGVILIIRPCLDPNKKNLKYLEGFSCNLNGIPTIVVFLHQNKDYNRRILSTIFFCLGYLINTKMALNKAYLFSHYFFLNDDIVLGNMDKDMKEQFILDINNDNEYLYQVFKRVYKICGLSVPNVIKTLVSIGYLNKKETLNYYDFLITRLDDDMKFNEFKPDPISVNSTVDYIKSNIISKKTVKYNNNYLTKNKNILYYK